MLGIPAFFTDGVPAWGRVVVAFSIAATVVGIWLLVAAVRQPRVRTRHDRVTDRL